MHEEEEEDDGSERSSQRPSPLKRSKTINVSSLLTPSENSKQRATEESRLPKSSCQALRHAVSALSCIDDFYLEELGSGFFANVYKATHKVTNEETVMKINKDMANRPSALREVQLMNKLSHPNILRFLGVCVHEGQLHALTEYVDGGTLENLLASKEEELPWTVRIKLSLDIARGIHYVHACGVIHRDLSSQNILIKKGENRNYTAIIADFGLATKIPDKNATVPLNTVGSPWWMAPEVVTGQFYDERADLFSFGIINMELTTRIDSDPDRMPRTNSFGVDYVRICELVEYCPLDFLQLSFKCCQVQPDKRPSSSFIVNTLEKIYTTLCDSSLSHSGKFHKRSKSEDNIIQSMDSSLNMSGGENIFMTPHVIAQAMSQDDPHYSPANDNPFANISRLKDGRKLMDFQTRKMSVASPSPTNSNSIKSSVFIFPVEEMQSQSLPSSPLMLRKAAEKLHQASLHGSEVVKVDTEQMMTRSFCQEIEEDDILDEAFAADRRARFGSNRTRSLGSLDFFSCIGKNANFTKKSINSTLSDRKGLCNRITDILKESSFEDNANPDHHHDEDMEDCEHNGNNRNHNSNTVNRYEIEFSTGITAERLSTPNAEFNSRKPYLKFEKNGKAELNGVDSDSTSQDSDPTRLPLSEKKELNIKSDDKPILAVQTESFESDHFGKESRNVKNKMNLS